MKLTHGHNALIDLVRKLHLMGYIHHSEIGEIKGVSFNHSYKASGVEQTTVYEDTYHTILPSWMRSNEHSCSTVWYGQHQSHTYDHSYGNDLAWVVIYNFNPDVEDWRSRHQIISVAPENFGKWESPPFLPGAKPLHKIGWQLEWREDKEDTGSQSAPLQVIANVAPFVRGNKKGNLLYLAKKIIERYPLFGRVIFDVIDPEPAATPVPPEIALPLVLSNFQGRMVIRGDMLLAQPPAYWWGKPEKERARKLTII